MRRSSEEGYAVFRWIGRLVTRHYRLLVLLWVLVFAGALVANQIWPVSNVVSYNQTELLPKDTESSVAQNIIDSQFPGTLANSTATVVLVANDTTTEYYRWFVFDLQRAVEVSSNLTSGGSATVPLRIGGNLTLDRPIRFLSDPANASVYDVYESYAYALASRFHGLVHLQVQFTESAAGIYWGVPLYFVGTWIQTPGGSANDTAFRATSDYVNTTFPAAAAPWALGYLSAWYPAWRSSFTTAPSLGPQDRATFALDRAVPVFLNSTSLFDASQNTFQLGLLRTFNFVNFLNATLVRDTALSVFPPAGLASLPFFRDLDAQVPANATDAELHAFAEQEVLTYGVLQTPLTPPFNVTRFYISADHRIELVNYAFSKDARYTDANKAQPIADAVATLRDILTRLKSAYGAQARTYVTGSAPISIDQEHIFGGGSELFVTVALVILLLGLYFRSAVAPAFPLLTIGIAIFIANLFVYLVAVYLFNIDFTVTAILETVILAVGTDYSIFLVSRYRDEIHSGRPHEEAVRNAVIWAGESVATSGGAVLISFAALSLGSFPLMRTLGLTLGFAVTISLGISLTFIPAAVSLLNKRIFWPSGKTLARPRPKGQLTRTERYFHRAATGSMKRAKVLLVVAILITLPATYIVLTDQPTYDFSQGSPTTESSQGIDAISQAFGYGVVYPSYVVLQFPNPVLLPDGNVSVMEMGAVASLSSRLLAMESGLKSTEGPTNPQGSAVDYRNLSSMPESERKLVDTQIRPYIGKDNRTVRIVLVFTDPPFSLAAINAVDRMRTDITTIQLSDSALASAQIYLGGVTPVLSDVRSNMNRDLMIMALVVIAGLFLVLLFVLGSVLIPVRAILTILLSVSWTLALTILVFHVWKGYDIIFILPLALFVMAMGLGMDYDIFIITRIREEVAHGKKDAEAIAEATTRTGGIISACGIVMAGAFATLMLNPSPFLQEIGFALAFAILLDSMVVRIYLVPAIMVLAGKGNWWAPGPLQRVHVEDKGKKPEPTKAEDVDD
ncbi:MAG TPA: MMPL family transporter [Thermoplasmata archaeon]|nr:MMPL family transporter [Thermoplasmata archaeon]